MELVVIREKEPEKETVKEAVVTCDVEGKWVSMTCSIDTFVELRKAAEALNRSRQTQREFKYRKTGKINKARKLNIVFE